MRDFYVEHALRAPLEPAEECAYLRALDAAAARVRVHRYECLIDADRRRVLYRVGADDPNDVRTAAQHGDASANGIWIGTFHNRNPMLRRAAGPDDGLIDVLAETMHTGPVDGAKLVSALHAGCDWCLETHRVELVGIAVSPPCDRVLALYRAPDAESVRQAYRHLHGPFARVTALRRLDASQPADDRGLRDPWSGSASNAARR